MVKTDEKIKILVIKGNKYQAALEAAKRNIPFAFDKEVFNGTETIGKTNASVDDLNEWFCDSPLLAPFPIGTLLFWNEVKNESDSG
jgi:hypothetical protein